MINNGIYLTVASDLTSGERKKLERSGMERLTRGIYVRDPEEWEALEPWERHKVLAMALSTLHEESLLAGLSAAMVLGLPVEGCPDLVEMRSKGGRPGKLHRNTRSDALMLEHPRQVSKGVKTTSVENIVIDSTLWHGELDGIAIADDALRKNLITPDSLWTAIRSRGRMVGGNKVNMVAECANKLSESPRESKLKVWLVMEEIGPFVVQAAIYDERGRFIGRVDFLLPQFGVVIEYDGQDKYDGVFGKDPEQAARDDMARHHALSNAGLTVVRVDKDNFANGEWLTSVRAAIERAHPLGQERWQFRNGLWVGAESQLAA